MKSQFITMIAKSEFSDPREKLTMKYLRFPLSVLNFFGLWRNDRHPNFAYNFYGFCIVFFSQYAYAGFQIIYMVLSFGDIQKLAEASYLLLTQVTLCFKIIMLLLKKRKIEAIIKFTEADIFVPKKPSHTK